MKKIINPLHLDAEGLENLNNEILASQEKIDEISKRKKEMMNFFEENNIVDKSLSYQRLDLEYVKELSILNGLLDARKRVVLIEADNAIDTVGIGDTILIDLMYSKIDIDEMLIKLVPGIGDLDKEIKQISVNSPLGAAIYGKKVGEKTTYLVGENEFFVLIKSKLSLNEENAPKR